MHEVILDTEENNVLVAYLPTRKDLAIALEHGWYRIPVLHAPPIIREGKATLIAFYQPKAFGDDRYMVRWYAPITGLVILKRSEILPDEPLHPHAQKDYYVVGCAGMQQLAEPIPSKIPRRAIFFPTTLKKLFTATDINHLFNDSHLETLLWNEMLKADVPSERQFDIRAGGKWFKLDFAVFCKTANLDIECDGDAHQRSAAAVEKDKRRSNLLASAGWNVLRFTSSVLRTEMDNAMNMVHDTVNRYGGLIDPDTDGGFRYTSGPDELVLLRYWSDPAGTAPSDLTVIFIDPGVQYLDIIRHVLFCNWSTTGNTDVYFQFKDARGNSSSVIKGNFDIDAVIAPPADPGAIVGPLAPPFGSTQEYSVPAGPDAGAYVWVLPTGWTGSSSTNNITVDVGNVNNGSQLGVYALNGCGQSDTVFLDISTGFMERMSGELVTLYPSPTTGQFQVSGIHGNARILVYSSNGQVIRDLQTVQEAYTLDLSNEVNGLYAIRVVMGAAISHLKVMVQH